MWESEHVGRRGDLCKMCGWGWVISCYKYARTTYQYSCAYALALNAIGESNKQEERIHAGEFIHLEHSQPLKAI